MRYDNLRKNKRVRLDMPKETKNYFKYKQVMMYLVLCMSAISFYLLDMPEMSVYLMIIYDTLATRGKVCL